MANDCDTCDYGNGLETELPPLSPLKKSTQSNPSSTLVNELLHHSELRQISLDHNLGKISGDQLLREFTRILENIKDERGAGRINQLAILKVNRVLVEIQNFIPPALRPKILEVQYINELIDSDSYEQRLVDGLSRSRRELARVVSHPRLDIICQYQWSKAHEKYLELIDRLSIPRKAVVYALLENICPQEEFVADNHTALERAYGIGYSGNPDKSMVDHDSRNRFMQNERSITKDQMLLKLIKIICGILFMLTMSIFLLHR